MSSFFPIINENISKREKKMLDYDAARSRLRKLIDKPSEDPAKMPKVWILCQWPQLMACMY